MIGQAIDSNTLRVLASTRQVRDAVAGRDADDRTRWHRAVGENHSHNQSW
ncbi:hypothetical protein ACIPZ8_14675 [Pseudomonas sp. NPDC089422]